MFYYYGAKYRLAKLYPAPTCRTIIEPFAGSAGYSMVHLERDPSLQAVLVEKDLRVVELWRRLLAMTSKEVLSIEIPKAGERTEDFLFMCAAASNALARLKGYKFSERAAGQTASMLKRIARLVDVCRGRVEVIHGDYSVAPQQEATYFIDPPYQIVAAPTTKTACPRGMGYAANCSSDSIDFTKLGRWCQGLPGQVIVCEMDGATWLPFKPLHRQQNSQGVRYQEVVWLNTSV